jgi:hypothetical protein
MPTCREASEVTWRQQVNVDQVTDQASFLAFVRALAADRREAALKERAEPASPYGPDAGGCENDSIDTFLEAAARWAEDSNMGQSQGLPPGPSWHAFAVFLYCGKIYE